MFKMEVPYDKRIMQISLEDKNLAGVLVGRQGDYVSDKSEKEIVEESLDHVIGSQTLEELAKGKKDIVIISSIILVRFHQKLLRQSFFEELGVCHQMQESEFLLPQDFTVQVPKKS